MTCNPDAMKKWGEIRNKKCKYSYIRVKKRIRDSGSAFTALILPMRLSGCDCGDCEIPAESASLPRLFQAI
jgi:hypothetical protein